MPESKAVLEKMEEFWIRRYITGEPIRPPWVYDDDEGQVAVYVRYKSGGVPGFAFINMTHLNQYLKTPPPPCHHRRRDLTYQVSGQADWQTAARRG